MLPHLETRDRAMLRSDLDVQRKHWKSYGERERGRGGSRWRNLNRNEKSKDHGQPGTSQAAPE